MYDFCLLLCYLINVYVSVFTNPQASVCEDLSGGRELLLFFFFLPANGLLN